MENLIIKDKSVMLKINTKIFPLETIYSAAYVFLDKAYIHLDGNPDEYVTAELKSKCEEDLEKLGNEFNNELINYADYQKRAENTKKIREIILQRALITNETSLIDGPDEDTADMLDELEENDDLSFEDPEGIAVPWEEKYGKENPQNDNPSE